MVLFFSRSSLNSRFPLFLEDTDRLIHLSGKIVPVALDRDALVIASSPQYREIGTQILPMMSRGGAILLFCCMDVSNQREIRRDGLRGLTVAGHMICINQQPGS